MGRIRNPDRRQFARSMQLGQVDRVPPVGLDPIARLARDQRRSHDDAIMPGEGQLPLSAITARSGLVTEPNRASATCRLRHHVGRDYGAQRRHALAPLIDVEDMAHAILWAILRGKENGGEFLAVNAGRDDSNYQVRGLAEAVACHVPGTTVSINTNAPPDKRSYRVDFALFRSLASDSIPQVSLDQSITRLREGLVGVSFADKDFRTSPFMRLKTLEGHMAAGRLGTDLRWRFRSHALGTDAREIPEDAA